MIGVYKITNKINNKCYIGTSKNIEKRFQEHKTHYNSIQNCKKTLYKAFKKYGINNFSFEVIEETTLEDMFNREIYWIKFYNSFELGYNQTEGGDSAPHFNKLTKEQVDLIIEELKNSTENSEVIGEKFGVSGRMIRGINSGNYFYRDDYIQANYYMQKAKEGSFSKCLPKGGRSKADTLPRPSWEFVSASVMRGSDSVEVSECQRRFGYAAPEGHRKGA